MTNNKKDNLIDFARKEQQTKRYNNEIGKKNMALPKEIWI